MITKNKKQDFNNASERSKRSVRKEREAFFELNLEEMIEAGLHFGHRTSKVHPKMKPYLHSVKSTIHIIDIEKTVEKLEIALRFIQELISENKTLVLIGTKIQAKKIVKEIAEECGLFYVNERWVGGTFTNFEIIKKRMTYFKDLEKEKKEGELEKYTKKEKAKINQELQGLEIKFGGIKGMEKLPDAIFVLDMRKDDLAIKEAQMKGIKIIGISDTNVDPTLVDYPIPANDDAISSLKYILEKVKIAVEKGRGDAELKKTEEQKNE